MILLSWLKPLFKLDRPNERTLWLIGMNTVWNLVTVLKEFYQTKQCQKLFNVQNIRKIFKIIFVYNYFSRARYCMERIIFTMSRFRLIFIKFYNIPSLNISLNKNFTKQRYWLTIGCCAKSILWQKQCVKSYSM